MQQEEHPPRLPRLASVLKRLWRDSAGTPSQPVWRLRPFWRLIGRRLGKKRSATTNSMLPVLIKVFAGFSTIDGEVDEQYIDSSLGFLRYDYPEAIYSELRELYSQALKQSQDLDEIAKELADQLSHEEKILLGVQLYVLVSRGVRLHREQLIHFYLFMTNLGVASETIDLVYQLNRDDVTGKDDAAPEGAGKPLEVLHVANAKPADLVIETLPPDLALLAFRFQSQLLLKNTGSTTIIVRGRHLQQGEFCRLYQGQRVLLADSVLNYQDLTFYFNTKKDLSSAKLYLTFEQDGQPFVERELTKGSHLEIKFGLTIAVNTLRETRAKIGQTELIKGTEVEATLADKIVFEDHTEISFRELNRRARELGSRFELLRSRSEYLVSNNPNILRPGDILLSPGASGEVLLRIRCDYARKRGELEVLNASTTILAEGVPVRERVQLEDGATITIHEGQFLRCHFGERIIEEEQNVISHIDVRDVTHSYDGKETALDSITLSAHRGEMICVIGPSGCGKSTFLRVLSGHLRPNAGDIGLNEFSLYQNHADLTPYICYIPQEDAFDPHLTIQENIDYAAAIRSPHLLRRERRRRVDSKLVELGLNEQRHRLAGTPKDKFLSGGERKRLNAGMDMVSPADVFLFDEPTSGLSSKDSEHVLEIIHGLSRNKIVFVSIHQPSARLFRMFDKAMLLDRGGKLAFCGTPDEMLQYFEDARDENLVAPGQMSTGRLLNTTTTVDQRTTPDFVFDVLETPLRDLSGAPIYEEDDRGHLTPARRFLPEFWRDRFQAHRTLQEVKQLEPANANIQAVPPSFPTRPGRKDRELLNSTVTFFQRAFLSKLRNRANVVTTLVEAPLLALLIAAVLRWSEDDRYTFGGAFHIPTYLFLSLVVAMFLGLTNSADEIIRDRSLLTRERNLGSRLFNYLGTKFFTLGIFAAIQCAIFVLVGNGVLEIRGMFLHYFLWMLLTTMCGVAVGLLISAFVSDVKTALNIIPLILLPQIILGGALIKYQEMNRDLPILAGIKRWTQQNTDEVENPLQVPLICEFMPLRWSYEALVIAQGRHNPLARVVRIIGEREEQIANNPTLTKAEEEELAALKDARTIVLQLEAKNGRKIKREVRRIRRRVEKNSFSTSTYDRDAKDPHINVKEVFRNKKIYNLLDRSAMEVLDYRRDPNKPLNVFFGIEKTYLGICLPTIAANSIAVLIFIALVMISLWGALKHQLTRT